MDLLNDTIDMAKRADIPIPQICEDHEISKRWYTYFINGETPNASVTRVQNLYNYLTEKGIKPPSKRNKRAA